MTQTLAPLPAATSVFPSEPLRSVHPASMTILEHEGVLAVSGPDAARFLQGQITCDVSALSVPSSVPGARCNPKGRMQSSFRLLRQGEDQYLLAMAAELVERQRAELAKYAVFFKAQLSDESLRWTRLGVWGRDAEASLESAEIPVPSEVNGAIQYHSGLVVRTAESTFELWVEQDSVAPTIERLGHSCSVANWEDWLAQRIRLGHGQVVDATYESFIPQMLNLQLLAGVSFRKGCYTGQEIVARMQYLGKLKRRMYRLHMSGDETPAAGSSILDSASARNVGEVVIAARSVDGVELLAVLQKDAAQSTLRLADINGPLLTLMDLPYESELAAQEASSESSSRD